MGFTPYKAKRMKSAMPQTNGEDRGETYRAIEEKYLSQHKAKQDSLAKKQDQMLRKDYTRKSDSIANVFRNKAAHSLDSINNLINQDNAKTANMRAAWEADSTAYSRDEITKQEIMDKYPDVTFD